MIHSNQWLLVEQSECPGHECSDRERLGHSRSLRVNKQIYLRHGHVCLLKGLFDDVQHLRPMVLSRLFRHEASSWRRDERRPRIRQYISILVTDSDANLIR